MANDFILSPVEIIHNHYSELRSKIDLATESLISDAQNKRDELLEKISIQEQNCIEEMSTERDELSSQQLVEKIQSARDCLNRWFFIFINLFNKITRVKIYFISLGPTICRITKSKNRI